MWKKSIAACLLVPALAAAREGTGSQPPDGPLGSPLPSCFHWGDYDGDGLEDALVVPASGEARLIKNLGDGTFEDVTERAGLAGLRGVRGGLWQDYDGDGGPDLLIVTRGAGSALLRNVEGRAFEDVTSAAGLERLSAVREARWLDFDRDGRADLVVATSTEEALYRNLGRGRFERARLGIPAPAPAPWFAPGAPGPGQPAQPGQPGAAAPGGTTPATPGTGGRSAATAAAGGAASASPAGPGAQTGAQAPVCATSVDDFANPGSCISASTVPTVGMLFPLSVEWYVDGSGRVGIGTLTPGVELDVMGTVRANGQLVSTTPTGAPLSVVSSELVVNLNADQLDGFDAADFSQLGDTIETAELADGSVTSAKIAANAVTNAELANDAVTSGRILDGSVTAADLGANSVGASEIAASAVGSSELADGSVTSLKIAANAVTNAELANDAVTSGRILNGSITAADLGANSVAASEIAANAVGSSELADGSITAADLASNSVGAAEIAPGAVNTSELANDSVTAAKLAPGAVDAAALGTGSVTTIEILNQTILDDDVSNTANIRGTKINADFGAQDVTGTGDFGVGTSNPVTDLHVLGSATLGSALVAPNDTISGDDSELLLAEDHDGSFGMKFRYDGGFNQLLLLGRNLVDNASPTMTVDRDTRNVGIGPFTANTNLGRLVVDGGDNTAIPAIKVFGGGFTAVNASSFQTNGSTLYGSHAGDGTGVWGVSDGTGVYGQTNDTGGSGVYGYANFTTGTTYGVQGETESTSGRAVRGLANATTGTTYGVEGRSGSTSGRGVYGSAYATSGTVQGVRGFTGSSSGYGVYSSGDFGGTGAKYFIQPHPIDPSKQINFVCLEGNESGTYFRGSAQLVGGSAVIEVPEEFRLVSETEGLTVQLTAMGPGAELWIQAKNLDEIVVRGARDVEFDYFVNGVRRGYEDVQIVRDNHSFVPEERGVPFATQYPEAYRQILVENGILNPDFTPNEATAAALGWTLREPGLEEAEREARRASRQAHEELQAAYEAQQGEVAEPVRDGQ